MREQSLNIFLSFDFSEAKIKRYRNTPAGVNFDVLNDKIVTIWIGQGDAVLSSPVHLSHMAQCNLSSRILVNHQINWLDAGSIQILQNETKCTSQHVKPKQLQFNYTTR